VTKLAHMTVQELEVQFRSHLDSIGFHVAMAFGAILGTLLHSWWACLGLLVWPIYHATRMWIILRIVKARTKRYQKWMDQDGVG
jgi:hypothetical protein